MEINDPCEKPSKEFLITLLDIYKKHGLLSNNSNFDKILYKNIINYYDSVVIIESNYHNDNILCIFDYFDLYNETSSNINIKSSFHAFLFLLLEKYKEIKIDKASIKTIENNHKTYLEFKYDNFPCKIDVNYDDSLDGFKKIVLFLNELLTKYKFDYQLYFLDTNYDYICYIIKLKNEAFKDIYNNRLLFFTDFEYPEIIEWRKNISEEDLLF